MGATGEAGTPMLSRTRASHPAACGAEAEVPKNGLSKSPTPLTETPSAAAQLGRPLVTVIPGPATPVHGPAAFPGHVVVKPSWTGPPPLDGSMAPVLPLTAAAGGGLGWERRGGPPPPPLDGSMAPVIPLTAAAAVASRV